MLLLSPQVRLEKYVGFAQLEFLTAVIMLFITVRPPIPSCLSAEIAPCNAQQSVAKGILVALYRSAPSHIKIVKLIS